MYYIDLPEFNYTLTDPQFDGIANHNQTLFLHMQVEAENRYFSRDTQVARFHWLRQIWPSYPMIHRFYFNQTIPLVAYF